MTSPLSPGARIFTYARDSGHERQAASCDQQNHAYAEIAQKNGWVIVEQFTDQARKGSSTIGRDALQRLLAEAKRGAADAVVFWSSSRMARDVNDAQIIRATLRKAGYRLIFVSENFPDLGMYSPLVDVIADITNQKYLETLSADIKRGQAAALDRGLVPCGKPPFGYKNERVQYGTNRDGTPRTAPRWVIDPVRQAQVALAWSMRLQGHSYLSINRQTKLYANGTRLADFFRNKAYMGTLEWAGRQYENFLPAYVTSEQWQRAQAITAELDKLHPRTKGSNLLLVGLIFCPACGTRMFSANAYRAPKKIYRYYGCGRLRMGLDCTNRGLIPTTLLESKVVDFVVRSYSDPETLRDLYMAWNGDSGTDQQAQIDRLTSEIAELTRKINRLLDQVEEGGAVSGRLAEREAERAAKQAELDSLRRAPVRKLTPIEAAASVAADLKAAYENGDRDGLKVLLKKCVLRIEAQRDIAPVITLRPLFAD